MKTFQKRLLVCVFSFILFFGISSDIIAADGDTLWAKSTVVAPGQSEYLSVATDTDGNIYAVGLISGSLQYDFGNGVTITGASGNSNLLLVKYNSSGVVQWAKTTVVSPSTSTYYDVVVDSLGNIYAVGFIRGSGTYNFGNSVSTNGQYASDRNGVIVKYNSLGEAQWAKSTSTASNLSEFMGVGVDSLDLPYLVGYLYGNTSFGFGNGISATGLYNDTNSIIIKYDTDGLAQWAKVASGAPSATYFEDLSFDSSNNVYAVGTLNTSATYDFGNSITVAGVNASSNALIVKYNSSGVAQWAKSTYLLGPSTSTFTAVIVDDDGNSYVSGSINSTGTFGWGNNITVAGKVVGDTNGFIIKYDTLGVPQWATSATVAPVRVTFSEIGIDSLNNPYIVGIINGSATINFGNSVTVTGGIYNNSLLLKYNSSGVAQWAKTTVSGPEDSTFYGVSIDSSDNVIVAGLIYSNNVFDFLNGVTVNGAHVTSRNGVVVKYSGPPVVTPTATPSISVVTDLTIGGESNCNQSAPTVTPDLFQINTTNNTAKLFFTPSGDASSYYISYSTKEIAEEHGVSETLSKVGVQSYTVNLLKPNTIYYFKVRSQNGCTAGKWSNIMKISTNPRIFYKGYKYQPYKVNAKKLTPVVENPKVVTLSTPEPIMVTPAPVSKTCFLMWCW